MTEETTPEKSEARGHLDLVDKKLGKLFRELTENSDLLAAANQPTNQKEQASVAAQLMPQLLDGTDLLIGIVNEDDYNFCQILAGTGKLANLVDREFPLEESYALKAFETGNNVEFATNGVDNVDFSNDGLNGAILLVPLQAEVQQKNPWNVLGFMSFYQEGVTSFSAEDKRLLNVYALMCASSVQRTALLELNEQANRRLKIQMELSNDLTSSLEPKEVISALLKRTAKELDAERVTLFRYENESRLVVEESYDINGPGLEAGTLVNPLDYPKMLESLTNKIAIQIPNTDNYPNEGPPPLLPHKNHLQALEHSLIMPLTMGDELTSLLVLMRTHDTPFNKNDFQNIEAISNIASAALQNAHLFEKAQEATRAKSEFLNLAAHELRTPITVIAGYLALLKDGSFGEPSEKWLKPVDIMEAKTEELNLLVEELLMAARIESGKLPIKQEKIDLCELVAQAVKRATPRASLIGAQIHWESRQQKSFKIMADPTHVLNILDNLINNALTYSRDDVPSRIEVAIENGTNVKVHVKDNGLGIAQPVQEKIFERFYRVEQKEGKVHPGTGLGLYISKELATRNRGNLHIEHSEVGVGTEFALEFPVVNP